MKAPLHDCLETLQDKGLLPADHLAVLCVGSMARGWANETSDYDFNVVTRGPWQGASARTVPVPLVPGTIPAAAFHVNGKRWEVKYWMDSQVDQMMAKVTWEQFEAGTTTAKVLIDAEELFLERLTTCVTLSGAGWVRGRRQALEDSAFRAFVISRSLAAADEAVEDALGQLGAADDDSAVLSARKAYGHTVDALLESRGAYGSRTPKWRARRFREAQPVELSYEEYWATETMRDFKPADPGAWVTSVIHRCRELALDVEIS
ncbi:hypothetical protein [Streptomyces sp. NPDC096339]|uniref:hypothetical protein n=1 Tax=Streptomyces sp. NPDC096339 TaxID=3366086 RepID=UPI00380C7B4E